MSRRWIVILGVLVVAMAATLPLAGAQTAPNITPLPTRSVLLVEDAFVRSGPSESFVAVGRLTPGAPLIALNRSEDGRWVLIRYNRGFGWLRRDLALWAVSIDSLPVLAANITPTPIPGEPTATLFIPTNTPTGDYVRVIATSAYLRGGPGITYLRLGQLFPGSSLDPVGRNEDTSWILVRTDDGFAWIRRDLGSWVTDLETLPVLQEDNLTPTLTFTPSTTPTRTPSPTNTATPTDTPTNTATATTTPSPTLTETPTPSETATVTPSPTETDTPEPTATFTDAPTATTEPSAAPTDTAPAPTTVVPSATSTDVPPTATTTATNTDVPTATPTDTETPEPTATVTDEPTVTDTPTTEPTQESAQVAATDTSAPSTLTAAEAVGTLSGTTTAIARSQTQAAAPLATETAEPTATDTPQPTDTASPAPSETPTDEPSATNTPSPEPSATPTDEPTATETPEPTETDAPAVSETPTDEPTTETRADATATETLAPIPAATPEPESSATADDVTAVAAVFTVTPVPPTDIPAASPVSPVTPVTTPPTEPSGLRPELIAAGIVLLLILGYIALYMRGAASAARYSEGFIIKECPVCREGQLFVESRTERNLGIPNTKHVVRCSHCRSVLREVGGGRWRYAVDRTANQQLFERLNNRELREDTLKRLLDVPADASGARVTPELLDDDPEA